MAVLRTIIALAFVLALGFLLVILSCALDRNWLPLLVAAMFVLATAPNSVFGRFARNDDFQMDNNGSGAVDVGRFLTSILIVTGFCLPSVFAHTDIITTRAMYMSIGGGVLIYSTIIAYAHFFAADGEDF